MLLSNTQLNDIPSELKNITQSELFQVIEYFRKLGYHPDKQTVQKIVELSDDYPDRDFVLCAKEMYEWFSEAKKRGRKIKSYHLTFRNWVKKDYAPKREKQQSFFDRNDLY